MTPEQVDIITNTHARASDEDAELIEQAFPELNLKRITEPEPFSIVKSDWDAYYRDGFGKWYYTIRNGGWILSSWECCRVYMLKNPGEYTIA